MGLLRSTESRCTPGGAMSHAVIYELRPLLPSRSRSDLRARIGWICHALRIAAVIWIGWGLVRVLIVWGNKARMLETAGWVIGIDLSGVSNARYAAAFALTLLDWCITAGFVICVWRLFGTYLTGR